MKIAIVGCAHGELDKIYSAVEFIETQNKIKIDALLCCGDFQAVRNRGDLFCMAVPPKYRQMNTFYKYYSGELRAPVLTLFVGGNHEASNHLSELPFGGWVAPNIFYLGLCGVVRLGSLRIAGISGIFKGHDYLRGHFERPPYSDETIRSVYHVRNLEAFRLQQLKNFPPDVILSHDWPRGIHSFGNETQLFRRKPYFRDDANDNKLGSQPLKDILDKIMPTYWFSAHMHVKFSAFYEKNGKATKFLALDKCLPHRDYLQILDIENESSADNFCAEKLSYDKYWLAILRSTNHLLNTTNRTSYMPGPGIEERFDFFPTFEELEEVEKIFQGDFTIPENFVQTAMIYDIGASKKHVAPEFYANPQTEEFCNKLKITNLNRILAEKSGFSNQPSSSASVTTPLTIFEQRNPDEISLDDEMSSSASGNFAKTISTNPDEICLSDEEKNEEKIEVENTISDNQVCSSVSDSCNVNVTPSDKDFPVFKRRNAALYCRTDGDEDV